MYEKEHFSNSIEVSSLNIIQKWLYLIIVITTKGSIIINVIFCYYKIQNIPIFSILININY